MSWERKCEYLHLQKKWKYYHCNRKGSKDKNGRLGMKKDGMRRKCWNTKGWKIGNNIEDCESKDSLDLQGKPPNMKKTMEEKERIL